MLKSYDVICVSHCRYDLFLANFVIWFETEICTCKNLFSFEKSITKRHIVTTYFFPSLKIKEQQNYFLCSKHMAGWNCDLFFWTLVSYHDIIVKMTLHFYYDDIMSFQNIYDILHQQIGVNYFNNYSVFLIFFPHQFWNVSTFNKQSHVFFYRINLSLTM